MMVRGGGLFKKKIEDIHLYRFSCILVHIFAYYGSFAPKRHVDSYTMQVVCEFDPQKKRKTLDKFVHANIDNFRLFSLDFTPVIKYIYIAIFIFS